MRRKSLLLCLMFMSILGMTAHSNVDNTVPHRKVYGFFYAGIHWEVMDSATYI